MVKKTVDFNNDLFYSVFCKMKFLHITSFSFVVRELLKKWVSGDITIDFEDIKKP